MVHAVSQLGVIITSERSTVTWPGLLKWILSFCKIISYGNIAFYTWMVSVWSGRCFACLWYIRVCVHTCTYVCMCVRTGAYEEAYAHRKPKHRTKTSRILSAGAGKHNPFSRRPREGEGQGKLAVLVVWELISCQSVHVMWLETRRLSTLLWAFIMKMLSMTQHLSCQITHAFPQLVPVPHHGFLLLKVFK